MKASVTEFHRYVTEAYDSRVGERFLQAVGGVTSICYSDAMDVLDRVLLGDGKPIAPIFGRTGSLPVEVKVPEGIYQAISDHEAGRD